MSKFWHTSLLSNFPESLKQVVFPRSTSLLFRSQPCLSFLLFLFRSHPCLSFLLYLFSSHPCLSFLKFCDVMNCCFCSSLLPDAFLILLWTLKWRENFVFKIFKLQIDKFISWSFCFWFLQTIEIINQISSLGFKNMQEWVLVQVFIPLQGHIWKALQWPKPIHLYNIHKLIVCKNTTRDLSPKIVTHTLSDTFMRFQKVFKALSLTL